MAFELRYAALGAESYDWNLWGAAYLMKGGCSDDAFDYFRGWLVTQGRTTWERALRDPDTFAELDIDPDDEFLECERMLLVGRAAFEEDAGFYAAVDAARAELPADTFHGPLLGDDLDHEDGDTVCAQYPRLSAIYV